MNRPSPPSAPAPAAVAIEDTRELELGGASHEGGVIEVPIPDTYVFFRGHFPGSPMLPGIVQLGEISTLELDRRDDPFQIPLSRNEPEAPRAVVARTKPEREALLERRSVGGEDP